MAKNNTLLAEVAELCLTAAPYLNDTWGFENGYAKLQVASTGLAQQTWRLLSFPASGFTCLLKYCLALLALV